MAGLGDSNCNSLNGYQDIDDVQDCENFASKSKIKFAGSEVRIGQASFTKGCHLLLGRTIWFNQPWPSMGNKPILQEHAHPICKKSMFLQQ